MPKEINTQANCDMRAARERLAHCRNGTQAGSDMNGSSRANRRGFGPSDPLKHN